MVALRLQGLEEVSDSEFDVRGNRGESQEPKLSRDCCKTSYCREFIGIGLPKWRFETVSSDQAASLSVFLLGTSWLLVPGGPCLFALFPKPRPNPSFPAGPKGGLAKKQTYQSTSPV